MKSLTTNRARLSGLTLVLLFSLSCTSTLPGGSTAQVERPSILYEEFRARAAGQAADDPLIGIWSGGQCGFSVVLAVVRNDDETPYKLKAVILNGSQVGYGFFDGHPWFYASPLAAPGTYEGRITYRNVLWQRWFPTRILMTGQDAFTTYDDVTLRTCGGTIHTYLRKDPRPDVDVARVASGSGFLLWNTTLVLTANHVVEKASRIRIRFPMTEEYEARVLARDSTNDLALLEVRGFQATTTRGFRVNPQTVIVVGEAVHVLGYPLAPRLSRAASIVSGQVSSAVGLEDSPNQFRMTAPINLGSSGGPILNQHGAVVGIAVSALRHRLVEGITFGIKIGAALPVLQHTGVSFGAGNGDRLTPAQIFTRYAQDVVMIEAF